MDKLDDMYNQQRDFNLLLRDERLYPDFPLDLSQKKNQQILKGLAYECMHELFEANHLLKNSKLLYLIYLYILDKYKLINKNNFKLLIQFNKFKHKFHLKVKNRQDKYKWIMNTL